MVKSISALTRSGMKDWFVQRVSAVLMAIYIIFLVGFIITHSFSGPLSYGSWSCLFHNLFFKIATIIILLSLIFHAWIGVWTIFTDYIHCSVLRGTLQVLVFLAMFSCTLWGVWILWG